LTRWEISSDDALCGSIELPMAVGLVGGATKSHPAAQAALALMEVTSANELGQVIAAVGLAQNMAALRALATEGIQRGHMTLHARNIAISAGATGAQIDHVVRAMLDAGDISASHAKAIIDGH
jgi:hydroxymethylglutaryl-CoA reductase